MIARNCRVLTCILVILAVLGGVVSAQAQLSPSAQRGMTFARANCAQCHAVDKVSPSPLSIAPPFRTLHERYSVETLEEALGEGIITGHKNMPEFQLESDQIRDFIDYLKSLER